MRWYIAGTGCDELGKKGTTYEVVVPVVQYHVDSPETNMATR
jgi:hypothetical protein